jgi:hypothetical protein
MVRQPDATMQSPRTNCEIPCEALNPKTGRWRMQSRETGLRRQIPGYQGK